jgi:hypothetical protein
MLELVDRHDSGSCVRKGVEVQVLFGAGRLWIRAHSFDNSDSILCVDKKAWSTALQRVLNPYSWKSFSCDFSCDVIVDA